MEQVKFTDDTYRSLSNDTIITSSSDKREWCFKKKCTNCLIRKVFLEKVVVYLVSINSTRSPTAKVRKGESIAKVRFKSFICTIYIIKGHQSRSLYPARAVRAG